ncbi:MAG TPA: hypothetical protein VGN07_11305 [Steroidobacteraceae bacterium]|jgi:hypothetical protein
MKEIALASRTQSDEIGTLNTAIERIDSDTQQNAARVEQTAAVAASLREQVRSLMNAVDSFVLSEDKVPDPRIAPRAVHRTAEGTQLQAAA